MDRQQYLNEISEHLKSLPAKEYNDAMNYFTELFNERKNDIELIRELGNPKDASYKALSHILDRKISIIENEDLQENMEYRREYKDKIENDSEESKNKKNLFIISIMTLLDSPLEKKEKVKVMSIIVIIIASIILFLFTAGRKIISLLGVGMFFIFVLGKEAFEASTSSGLLTAGIGLILAGSMIILIAGVIFVINIIFEYLAKYIQTVIRKKA